ncbi:MAG: hypothetical protein R2783_09335, partial [Gelidibacter sp.]
MKKTSVKRKKHRQNALLWFLVFSNLLTKYMFFSISKQVWMLFFLKLKILRMPPSKIQNQSIGWQPINPSVSIRI